MNEWMNPLHVAHSVCVESVCQAFAAFAWGHVLRWHKTSSNPLFLQDGPLHRWAAHISFPKQQEFAFFVVEVCAITLLSDALIAAFGGDGTSHWYENTVPVSQERRFHLLTQIPSQSRIIFRIILSLFLRVRETFSDMYFFWYIAMETQAQQRFLSYLCFQTSQIFLIWSFS